MCYMLLDTEAMMIYAAHVSLEQHKKDSIIHLQGEETDKYELIDTQLNNESI